MQYNLSKYIFRLLSFKMSLSLPDRKAQLRHYACRKLLAMAPGFRHRGSAWMLGLLLIGLIAVGLVLASGYANKRNHLLLAAFPLAPLLVLPAGAVPIARLTPTTRYAKQRPPMSVSALASTVSKLICPIALYLALVTHFSAAPAALEAQAPTADRG